MSLFRALRPSLPILIGASVMLSLAMGLRQSLGIFMPPLTRDTGIAVSDFTLAIAVQNLAWGALQPLAGAWAVRLGMRRLMVGGALLYILGLVLLATTSGLLAWCWARVWHRGGDGLHRQRAGHGRGVAPGAGGRAQLGAGHRVGGRLAGGDDRRAHRPGAVAVSTAGASGCGASWCWRC
jgi:MFS family permease